MTKTDKIDATAICRYIMNNNRSIISDINHYGKQIKGLKKTITTKLKLFPKITSVPGIGPWSLIISKTSSMISSQSKSKYFLEPINSP